MNERPSNEAGRRILGPDGVPIPPRQTWSDHWRSTSRTTRVIAFSLVAAIATIATLATHLRTILSLFPPTASAVSVPPITVEITNSSNVPIVVAARGDFFLRFPGPDTRQTFGKFELFKLDGSAPQSGTLTVAPLGKMRVTARVANHDLFGRLLKQGDCEIAFMISKAGGGHKTTDNLPFTKAALEKYYATVDIGNAQPDGGVVSPAAASLVNPVKVSRPEHPPAKGVGPRTAALGQCKEQYDRCLNSYRISMQIDDAERQCEVMRKECVRQQSRAIAVSPSP